MQIVACFLTGQNVSIRPFQGVIKGRPAGYFLRNRGGTPAFFYAWATRDGCHCKSLSETQYLNQTYEARTEFLITGVRADVCFASSPCYPSSCGSHCPSPTSSAPVYTILKGSTQRTGSLHNCYLKHINQIAYLISLYSFKQFILILILKTKF